MLISRELQLALDCCRRGFSSRESRSDLNLNTGADLHRFLRLTRFHRIQGLAWNAIAPQRAQIPSEVADALSQDAIAIAASNLASASEAKRLNSQFEKLGVPLLFLKGVTLGALAYGNPALKSAIDLDLLIDPDHLLRTADLLRSSGYELIAPRESPKDRILQAWHVGWKESVWTMSSPPLQIDLHTRTADNSLVIPTIGVRSPRQSVELGKGIYLPTLADEELFAYLAVHGASSAWFRLKWISDFAGLLHRRSADEIKHLYHRSQQLRAGRAAGQALLLADALFSTLEKTPDLKEELRSDRATRWLCHAALRIVTGELREPTETRGGTLTMHWTQFLLLPGARYKLAELKRQTIRLGNAEA